MSVSRSKMLAITGVIFVLGALLGQVDGCSCASGIELCDLIEEAPIVVHATALSRSDQADINDAITYTVNTITIYKSEPNTSYEQVLSFTTGGNSALCGVYLEIGEEYLIDLVRITSSLVETETGGLQAVGICGAFRLWSSVTDEDLDTIEYGGCPVIEGDLSCGDTACGEFQECLLHAEGTADEEYYCTDVCDPSPCADDEVCWLFPVVCFSEPCPSFSYCVPPVSSDSSTTTPSVSDACDACTDLQTCGMYAGNEKWYCSDTCGDGACSEGEQCELRTRNWCRDGGAGCPQKRKCF